MTTRRGQLVWLIAWWLPLAAVAVGQEADQSPPSPFANPEQSPAGLGDLLPAVDRAAASDASDPQPAPPQRATKAAVPAPAAQAAVLKQIDEIFGRPTQPAQMLKLAATLLKTGQEDKVPANQYAQFRRAGELALAAGDLQVAAQAADLLGARFQIDVLALKAGLAEQSAGRIDLVDSDCQTARDGLAGLRGGARQGGHVTELDRFGRCRRTDRRQPDHGRHRHCHKTECYVSPFEIRHDSISPCGASAHSPQAGPLPMKAFRSIRQYSRPRYRESSSRR